VGSKRGLFKLEETLMPPHSRAWYWYEQYKHLWGRELFVWG
jgi:hypothetical protein